MLILIRHVKRHAGSGKGRVHTGCLYRYDEPVSPHLAARLATDNDVSKVNLVLSFNFIEC